MKKIVIAVLLLSLILLLSSSNIFHALFRSPSFASDILLGRIDQTDLAQDMYGFRAMVSRIDPYPILGDIFPLLGVGGPLVHHSSTHPPTAFLLVAPIAFLSWPVASIIWGWLMLLAIYLSLHIWGYSWPEAGILIVLLLFFPPVSTSLGQQTPIWLLGISLAYKNRSSNPIFSGFWLGLASLSKFMPGLLLVLFIVRKKWSPVVGFLCVWVFALLSCILISPTSLKKYIEVNRENTINQIIRFDNANPIWFSYQYLGIVGILIIFTIIVLLILRFWRDIFTNPNISAPSWDLLSYFAVMLLPVIWTYSPLPLLPILLEGVQKRDIRKFFSWGAILLFLLMPLWGDDTVRFILIGLVFTGFVILLPQGFALSRNRIRYSGNGQKFV